MHLPKSYGLFLLVTLGMLLVGIMGYRAVQAGSNEYTFLPLIKGGGSNPPPGSSNTLANGGHVDWPDGGGIAALSDTLSAPVEVSITVVSDPGYDLPEDTQVMGSYYEVWADADTAVSTGSPFIIAFPIPANVSLDHLGLAVLLPAESALDSGPLADFGWQLLAGQVDVANRLFITTLPFLAQDGRVFVLISHPDLISPANSQQAALNREPDTSLFSVECRPFYYHLCNEATKSQLEGLLQDIHTAFDSLGYPEPRLKNLVAELDYPPSSGSLASLGYTVYIEPPNRGLCHLLPASGHYDLETGHLAICLPDPAAGISDDDERVVVHEYFHAVEFAFTAVINEPWEDWIIEGMAQSVEESYFAVNYEMTRSEVGGWVHLHPVDVALTNEGSNWLSDDMAYFAQDFWVYIGQTIFQDMGYLKVILNQGANTDAAESTLPLLGFPLGESYWLWAKNQFFEKNIDFDGALGTPCYFDKPVADPNAIIYWSDSSPFNFASGTIDPLSSFVVQFDWEAAESLDYLTIWEINKIIDPQLPLEYKVYEEGATCTGGIPDGRRTLENVTNQKTYYILLSNTSTTDTVPFQLTYD